MLCGIEQFWIEAHLSGVRELEAHLKQGLAGAQGEIVGVTVLFFLWNRISLERLSARGFRGGIHDLRAVRQVELEVLVVHLSARRAGSIIHREQTGNLKLVSLGLKTHDVSGNADVIELFRDVKDLHFYRVRARRRHAVVGHALVDSANQVRTRVREFEAEVAAGVALGACGFFHSLAKFDQDNVIAGGGLAGGSVLERAF